MGLDDVWRHCAYTGYQVWVWLRDEAGMYPLMFLGAVVVIISAWVLFKSEVRIK